MKKLLVLLLASGVLLLGVTLLAQCCECGSPGGDGTLERA